MMHEVHISELKNLAGRNVKNSLLRYRRAKSSNLENTVECYLSWDAVKILESQGIDIKDDEKVLIHFDQYVQERKGGLKLCIQRYGE